MKVGKLNNFNAKVILKINKYKIDWENDGDSSLEIKFRDLIYPYWKSHIVLFQCFVPGSKLRLDFLNCTMRLLVEIDGEQHDKFNKHFHRNSKNVWLASMRRDESKERWCEENNIKVVHLVKEDLDNFSLEDIEKKSGISIV
jgi:hypothetical protein